MSTAILYIRVSTDEQASKGYSQRNQAERLQRFCTHNRIKILQTVFEDHSAKTFKRREWNKLMLQLAGHKNERPDLLLFTRWDRFSRNTGDAYYMITLLQKWKIEPQAIDQPLDLIIPENRLILAIYISMAEVENARLSLNVKLNLNKAKREGRWIGKAPIGYINCTLPSGKKSIAPHEPEAFLIKKIFQRVVEQPADIRSLYRSSIADGIRCSLNNFWHIIRNPIYCGKVSIPPFGKKEGYIITGVHEPIITEELFGLVQKILDGRKKHSYCHHPINELLPLRGFLYCPNCNHKLSGSGSKGRAKRYFYYHCTTPCTYRIRADKVNEVFCKTIGNLKASNVYIDLYKEVIKEVQRETYNQQIIDQAYITTAIHKLISRSTSANEQLIKGNIDNEDYLAIKQDCEGRINTLGEQLNQAYAGALKQKKSLEDTAAQLSQLLYLYEHSEHATKKQLLSLLFKKNAVIDQSNFNSMLSPAIMIIYDINYISRKASNVQQEELGIFDTDNISKFESSMIHRIKEIERLKGRDIQEMVSLQILEVLKAFAMLFPKVI